MSACAPKGDFGRPRQFKIQEMALAYAQDSILGTAMDLLVPNSSQYGNHQFGLTKHEIIVRDAALHFNQALTKAEQLPGVSITPTAYAEYMTSAEFTDGKSRVTFISAQIKSDFIWLKRFAVSARKVKIDDGERALYLQTREYGLTDQDRIRTYSRIKENEQIVYGVFKDMDDRIASYNYVIDRTPLETPGASTDELKTALETLRKEAALTRVQYDKLARRIARLRVGYLKRRGAVKKKRPGTMGQRLSGDRNNNNNNSSRGNSSMSGNTHKSSNGRNSYAKDAHNAHNTPNAYKKYNQNHNGTRGRVNMTRLKSLSPKLMKLRVPKVMRRKKAKPVKKVMKKRLPLPVKRMNLPSSWPMVITPAQK